VHALLLNIRKQQTNLIKKGMNEFMNIEFGVLISICLALLSIITFSTNRRRNSIEEGKELAMIMSKLDFLQNDMKDVKAEHRVEFKQMRELLSSLHEEVSILKNSVNTGHRRIDKLEERIEAIERSNHG